MNLTAAKVLVTGRVFKIDSDVFLVAKIIRTEISRVYGEMVQGKTTDYLADLSSDLTWPPATSSQWIVNPASAQILAEHVAANTALQNGTAELAEGLIPKLLK